MTDEEAQADTERTPMFHNPADAADAAETRDPMTNANVQIKSDIQEIRASRATPPSRCVRLNDTHITRSERLRREACAEKEAAWFYGTLGGRVPDSGRHRAAAAAIEQWLQSVLTYHRGALALWNAKREWPSWLREAFRSAPSLVVRLECALHPAVGRSNADLEAASLERIALLLAEARARGGRQGEELRRLDLRARKHFKLAVLALANARGGAPCMAPTEGR
jgi:hypothetical protein